MGRGRGAIGGGSDAEADRPGRLRSVFFELPHAWHLGSGGKTGLERRRREAAARAWARSAQASKPVEPGRVSAQASKIWVYCTLGHSKMCQIMSFFEYKLIRV